jgi:hypothetical protein
MLDSSFSGSLSSRPSDTSGKVRAPAAVSNWEIALMIAMWAHHWARAENRAGSAFCTANTSARANTSAPAEATSEPVPTNAVMTPVRCPGARPGRVGGGRQLLGAV